MRLVGLEATSGLVLIYTVASPAGKRFAPQLVELRLKTSTLTLVRGIRAEFIWFWQIFCIGGSRGVAPVIQCASGVYHNQTATLTNLN